jgi:predicted SAM-dependent methyltransferase
MNIKKAISLKINIGCGDTPTKGWRNYDNSWSVRLAKNKLLTYILWKSWFLSEAQDKFISFAKNANILWADGIKRIPENDSSVDVIYSCHMIEHLEKLDVASFFKEARRILKSGGIIRIAVPNIKYQVDNYLKDGDADKFIESTYLTRKKPKTIIAKIKYLIIGDRNHQWMYDGKSLCNLLSSAGFEEPRILEPGLTTIPDPGMLDLTERSHESVFVEAVNA